jgi:hypothetical protein
LRESCRAVCVKAGGVLYKCGALDDLYCCSLLTRADVLHRVGNVKRIQNNENNETSDIKK